MADSSSAAGGPRARADATATPQPPPFPWPWLLPSLAALIGLTTWGALVYPRLPARVPQHMGPDGIDAYAAKSVGTVFLPVLVYAGVVLLMVVVTVMLLRIRPESELRPGERLGLTALVTNRPATRAGAARVARATLLLTFCVGLTVAATCAVMWQPEPWQDPPGWLLVAVLVPVALGTAWLLYVAVRDHRDRGRQHNDGAAPTS